MFANHVSLFNSLDTRTVNKEFFNFFDLNAMFPSNLLDKLSEPDESFDNHLDMNRATPTAFLTCSLHVILHRLAKPLYETAYALFNRRLRVIAEQSPRFFDVGIGDGSVAGLRRLRLDYGAFAERLFE